MAASAQIPPTRLRATAVAAAVLMVFSVIIIAGPTAQAQCTYSIDLPFTQAGAKDGTEVGRAQSDTTRIVNVKNTSSSSCLPMDKLVFKANKGVGTFSGVNMNGKQIDFKQGISEAVGWNPVHNNDASGSTLLQFDVANPGSGVFQLQPNAARDFTVGFSVTGNPPAGYVFTGSIEAHFGPNSATIPFEYKVDSDAPGFVAPNGAVSQDNDKNGRIDRMVVTFDQIIDRRTFVATDYDIEGYTITKTEFRVQGLDQNANPDPMSTNAACNFTGKGVYGCTEIIFHLAEGFAYDTGPTAPQFGYNPGTTTDMAANKLSSVIDSTVVEVDGAPPILVGAQAYHTDAGQSGPFEEIRVTFSEKIKSVAANGPTLDFDDIFYRDCNPSSSPACPNGNVNSIPATKGVIHPAEPGRDDLLTITVAGGSPPGLAAEDVASSIGDSICTSSGPLVQPVIRDLNNIAALANDCRRVFTINAILAEVNIDSFRLTLTFNGPVSSASDDKKPVGKEALDIVATSCTPTSGGCGPTGIIDVQHSAGSDQVVVVLNARVKPTDVDATATRIRILPNTIKATGTPAANPMTVPGQLLDMKDLTDPAITSAHTVDTDGNGVVDGVFVEFNELVNDASFCFFDQTCTQTPPPNEAPSDVVIEVKVPLGVATISGPFTFDTDLQANDRFGLIKWGDQNTPGLHAGTGVVVDIIVTPADPADPKPLFEDFATPPRPMKPIASGDLVERDGAPPIIMSAATVDANTVDASGQAVVPPCIVNAPNIGTATCKPDPNGFIDQYRLVFSEKITDSSFQTTQWKTGDGTKYKVTGMNTGNRLDDGPNDEILHVIFEEGSTPDTDARPQITYTKPGPSVNVRDLRLTDPGLKDLSGVPMNSFGETAVTEVDRALPVIVRVRGLPGTDTLEVTFSEAVDDGAAGALTREDFFYINAFQDPAKPSASGLSSATVDHTPGTRDVVLTLNGPLTLGDIENDRIGAVTNQIREVQPSLETNERQYALSLPKKLNEAPDAIPPGDVTDLRVDLVTANSARLSWTAPGDDGTGNGKVTRYIIKAAEGAELTAANFESFVNPATISFSPDLTDEENIVEPGERQSVEVLGLKPNTEYYFGLIAEDDASEPNKSGVSNIELNETLGDVTVPVGELLATCDIQKNKPTLRTDVQCTWRAAADPESQVLYRYAINDQPEYQVKETDKSTTQLNVDLDLGGTGAWYFHVRAFSAGGPQPTTDHWGPMLIQYPTVPEVDIELFNLELQAATHVHREGGQNEINWTVPTGLPGELQGFKVWRLEEGEWVSISPLLPSTAVNFTDPEGLKSSKYLVTMVYKQDQSIDQPLATDYKGVSVEGAGGGGLAWWVYAILGVLLALVIAGVIVLMVLRGKNAPAVEHAHEHHFEETGPAGTDEETGLPTHDVKCPECSEEFQAVGNLPLQIACPNCGAGGTLE